MPAETMQPHATMPPAGVGQLDGRVMAPATDGMGALALAAALLTAAGTAQADDVRAVGGAALRAMGFEPPLTIWNDWGTAVRGFRARGLLVEDYYAGLWTAGEHLRAVFEPPQEWMDAARTAWLAERHNVL